MNNPTALRIGMSGRLFDATYRIRGRVVRRADAGGSCFYWHEFYLDSVENGEATLVFEETESGPRWSFLQYFEPRAPFTVADLAQVNEGATAGVDGFKGVIDMVGKVTVSAVEGEAPAGVRVGMTSNFFSATGSAVFVVTWSGKRIEHHVGQTISRGFVKAAFGADLPENYQPGGSSFASAGLGRHLPMLRKMAPFALLTAALVAGVIFWAPSRSTARDPGADIPAAARLDMSKPLDLQGRQHRIVGAAVVECSTEKIKRQGVLYDVIDDRGTRSRLLLGLDADETRWMFWDGLSRDHVIDIAPVRLGAQKPGASFVHAGREYQVGSLFRVRLTKAIRENPVDFTIGKTYSGLFAKCGSETVVFTWNEVSAVASTTVTLPKGAVQAKE